MILELRRFAHWANHDSRYNKTGGVVPVVRELSRTGGWYI